MLAIFKQQQERFDQQRRWAKILNRARELKEQIAFLRTQRSWET
jgi:hypothetical protein